MHSAPVDRSQSDALIARGVLALVRGRSGARLPSPRPSGRRVLSDTRLGSEARDGGLMFQPLEAVVERGGSGVGRARPRPLFLVTRRSGRPEEPTHGSLLPGVSQSSRPPRPGRSLGPVVTRKTRLFLSPSRLTCGEAVTRHGRSEGSAEAAEGAESGPAVPPGQAADLPAANRHGSVQAMFMTEFTTLRSQPTPVRRPPRSAASPGSAAPFGPSQRQR